MPKKQQQNDDNSKAGQGRARKEEKKQAKSNEEQAQKNKLIDESWEKGIKLKLQNISEKLIEIFAMF